MVSRYLAFRCFGEFEWPPVPSLPTVGLAKGIVEIHFILDEQRKRYIACLRWVPKASLDTEGHHWLPFTEPLSTLSSVYSLSPEELSDQFHKAAGPLAFRCDRRPRKNDSGIRLRFNGAQVFDQFSPEVDLGEVSPVPGLRIPLVRLYHDGIEDGKPERWLSAVQIGTTATTSKGGDVVRLDLAVPLPTPQDEEQHLNNSAYCAFSAVYSTSHPPYSSGTTGPVATSVTFGRRGRAQMLSLKPKIIGAFDFSLQQYVGKKPNWWQEAFWPTAETILSRTLPQFGWRTTAEPGKRLHDSFKAQPGHEFPGLHPKAYPSVSIESVGQKEHSIPGFRITQRMAISASGNGQAIDETKSDLRVRNDIIQLRMPRSPDNWIAMDKTIYLSMALEGRIADDKVWEEEHSLTGRFWLISSNDLTPFKSGSDVFAPQPEVPTLAGMVAHAATAMGLARLNVDHLWPATPQSILPELVLEKNEKGKRNFGIEMTFGANTKDSQPTVDHAKARATLVEGSSIRFTASWPAFHRETDPKIIDTRVRLEHDKGTDDENRLLSVAIVEEDTGSKRPEPLTSVLGSFAFNHGEQGLLEPASDLTNDADMSRLSIGPRRVLDAGRPRGNPVRLAGADLSVALRMKVVRVDPVAVDVPRASRSGFSPPLLLQEDKSVSGSYLLKLKESLGPTAERLLQATLLDLEAARTTVSSAILYSSQPFTWQRIYSRPLSARGGQDTVEVALYSSDTGQWQLKQVDRLYHYVLPPQSMGESMDKPGRLEIHDAVQAEDELKANGYLSPLPPQSDGVQRRAVEFRLTPPADLWIQPVDSDRNFYLPEWASGEIFGRRGEDSDNSRFDVGAPLSAFRGEFLYGLAVGVDPALEMGPARRVRVAEIQALTGNTVGVSETRSDHGARWGRLHRAIHSRPQRLEFWADHPDATTKYAPARFERGARFALRTTALHRPAVALLEAPVGEDGPGAPLAQPDVASLRLHPLGLSGGALWPVESHNVLSMILKEPASSGGEIEKIALSPLGGSADQKARFCGNRVKIISETRDGYVQRQQIEVIGRISVFWHKAKHVVVYERTVNPSAQFTPQKDLHTRTRRPVLRKVAEYVEILQAERRFPDTAAKPSTAHAFLRGLRFNDRIIPVDSAWAEELGTDGWKVPLWNRYAAATRPQVYPRPDITFITACEGHGKAPEDAQECLNPERLYFFTNTSDGATDDTDAWPWRATVDFIILPPPCHCWPVKPDTAEATSDVPQPNARQVPLGFERFTWYLAPPAQRTTINAGRGDKPIYAALESITFMRGPPIAMDESALTLLKAAVAFEDLPKETVTSIWRKGKPLDGNAPPALRGAAQLLDTISLPGMRPDNQAERDKIRNDLNKVKEVIKGLASDDGVTVAVAAVLKPIGKAVSELKVPQAPPSICEQLKNNAKMAVKAKSLSLLQELQAWEIAWGEALEEALGTVWDPLKSEDAFTRYMKAALGKALEPVYASTAVELGKFRHGIETARAAIANARQEVDNSRSAAQSRLEAVRQSVQLDRPWSQARLADFQQQIDIACLQIAEQLRSAIADARNRLLSDLDELARPAGTLAAQALAESTRQFIEFNEQTASQIMGFHTSLAALRSTIGALLGPDSPVHHARTAILAHQAEAADADKPKFDAALTAVAEIEKKLSGLQAGLDKLEPRIEELSGNIQTGLADAAKQWKDETQHFAELVDESVEQLKQTLTGLQEDAVSNLTALLESTKLQLDASAKAALDAIGKGGRWIDCFINSAIGSASWVITQISNAIEGVFEVIADAESFALSKVAEAEKQLAPKAVIGHLFDHAWAVAGLKDKLNDSGLLGDPSPPLQQEGVEFLRSLAAKFVEQAAQLLKQPEDLLNDLNKEIEEVCTVLGDSLARLEHRFNNVAEGFLQPFADTVDRYAESLFDKLDDLPADATEYKKLIDAFGDFDKDVRALVNDLARTEEMAKSYARDVINEVGRIASKDAEKIPGNILRALAAAGSAPALPHLDYARDRLAYYYGIVDDVIDTTPVEAWFGRLGDELKAMGICLPFDRIGSELLPVDLSRFDVSRVFRNFAGLRLGQLSPCDKLPASATNAIKISHHYDDKRFRAWVQVDVNLPLTERRSLFTVGPFTLDMLNATLVGKVRLEADKDDEGVAQTGNADLTADLEAVVAGQPMVTLREIVIRYNKTGGLHVEFDPKKVKLNPVFEFIQRTLQSIIPEKVGCMEVIKQDGMPVGLQHVFSLPPMGLMVGTSGVQNIQISNQFKLVAYPDFLIANRFSLATPDQPFIFSVFIVGGTGWLTVDVEYRPFRNALLVVVEAAAGGSASLGFAFAGCAGSVAITFSVALTYRKLIGQSGGGLTVSLVVVIFGVVDVLSIASAYIGVTLRLSYRENGAIDAAGSFRITIRISRFFKISTGGQVRYSVAGGQSQTNSIMYASVASTSSAYKKAEKLMASRGASFT